MEPHWRVEAPLGKVGRMNTEEVVDLLSTLAPSDGRVICQVKSEKDVGYLRISDAADAGRSAVVSSPGDRWVSLDVDQGFSLDHFEEGIEESDLRSVLDRYVRIGFAYVVHGATPRRRGWLPVDELLVGLEEGPVRLKRSLAGDFRHLLSRRRS